MNRARDIAMIPISFVALFSVCVYAGWMLQSCEVKTTDGIKTLRRKQRHAAGCVRDGELIRAVYASVMWAKSQLRRIRAHAAVVGIQGGTSRK